VSAAGFIAEKEKGGAPSPEKGETASSHFEPQERRKRGGGQSVTTLKKGNLPYFGTPVGKKEKKGISIDDFKEGSKQRPTSFLSVGRGEGGLRREENSLFPRIPSQKRKGNSSAGTFGPSKRELDDLFLFFHDVSGEEGDPPAGEKKAGSSLE